MLDQLIYTRCSPHRNLTNKGQVVLGDGFGLFSVSQELFARKEFANFDFLSARAALQNAAKENTDTGLFDSYEYTMVAPGVYALLHEVARPHCKIPRANGKTHRTGTYIKQCFIGEIEGYPIDWFGASAWDAHEKSENSYYLDSPPNAAPPWLPRVSRMPAGGYITPEAVKKFVSDGRADAVKAGIWFLLHEFEKPEGERKVLMIKDIPANVELWVAAIEYAFSVSMAKQIPFNTNCSKLGTETDKQLFYYTDETGKFYPMRNNGIAQTRHPYGMIVGFHPKDKFSAVKQMPVSNFVIIDGTTKTTGIQADNDIYMRPYYSAAVQYDADIQDFCSVVLPSLPFKGLTGKLPELFDAYKYLLDSNHKSDKWGYGDTLSHLAAFLQFGIPTNSALINYLIDECLAVYQRFSMKDENNGYPLLKYMWDMAKTVGKDRDITGCIADIVSNKLYHLGDHSNGITATWKALNASKAIEVLQPAMENMFNDTELSSYASQFKNSTPEAIETVVEMFFTMLSANRISLTAIVGSKTKKGFVCSAIVALLNDQNRVAAILRRLNAVPDTFNNIAISVGDYVTEHIPNKAASWWDIVMNACGGGVGDLCRKLCASKSTKIEMVEQLLANRVLRMRHFDEEIHRAFRESVSKLGVKPNTGSALYSAWVDVSTVSAFPEIIRSVGELGVSDRVELDIFHKVDGKMPIGCTKDVNPAIFGKMKTWADDLGEVSRSVSFYEFKRSFEKERTVEKSTTLAYNFAALNHTVDKQFVNTEYFADITAKAADFRDAELHMAMLCLFDGISDGPMDEYVDRYVAEIFDATKGRNMVEQMVSFCEVILGKFSVPARTKMFVSDIQRFVEMALANNIDEYYKRPMMDQLAKYTDCDMNVKKKLTAMLKAADEKAVPKGLNGMLNKLNNFNPFGKR